MPGTRLLARCRMLFHSLAARLDHATNADWPLPHRTAFEINVRLFSVVFELSIGCITQIGVNVWMLLEQWITGLKDTWIALANGMRVAAKSIPKNLLNKSSASGKDWNISQVEREEELEFEWGQALGKPCGLVTLVLQCGKKKRRLQYIVCG